MTQETEPQPLAFAGSFDDSGYICDDGILITLTENAEHRYLRREWIARHLRARIGEEIYQRGLSCIREAYEADIRNDLELKPHTHLHAFAARLRKARRLPDRGAEMPVAQPTASAFEEDVSVKSGEVLYELTCLGIADDRSRRNRDLNVPSIASCAPRTLARSSVLCAE